MSSERLFLPATGQPVPALLAGLIDYAGLFAPASLPMAQAVRNHADYLAGPDAAALGRFIVPLSRLPEFESHYAALPEPAQRHWRLSVLAGPNPSVDRIAMGDFNGRHPHAHIVAVEAKAATVAEVVEHASAYLPTTELWIEIPLDANPAPLLQAIKSVRRHAKIRTGGVNAAAFPSPAQVAGFLHACLAAQVVCKATAGLHHPLRGNYPLTAEPGSPKDTMFGFLNIFLAATLLRVGGPDADVLALLEESHASEFHLSPEVIRWRDHRFTAPDLTLTRQQFCRSFGCCSFTEPLAELAALNWR